MTTLPTAVNASLARLKSPHPQQPVISGQRLAPGVWIDHDTEQGQVRATQSGEEGTLLRIVSQGEGPCRWFTLNFDLGDSDLTGQAVLGYAVRLQTPGPALVLRAAVRSFHEHGYSDLFFDTPLVAHPDAGTQSDCLWIADQPELIAPAGWRILILFLQDSTFDLSITDMRVICA